jgi:hypothetical protein
MADRVSYAHATTCRRYRTKERAATFARDSPEVHSSYLTFSGLQRSRLAALINIPKGLGGDR